MTSDIKCIIGFFQLKNENPILSKTESQINMCQHPKHQVKVSRKGVLCAPDSRKLFETPCMIRIVQLNFNLSNSLIHILPLSNSQNNVASIRKNRDDKSHHVIVALENVGTQTSSLETI